LNLSWTKVNDVSLLGVQGVIFSASGRKNNPIEPAPGRNVHSLNLCCTKVMDVSKL